MNIFTQNKIHICDEGRGWFTEEDSYIKIDQIYIWFEHNSLICKIYILNSNEHDN